MIIHALCRGIRGKIWHRYDYQTANDHINSGEWYELVHILILKAELCNNSEVLRTEGSQGLYGRSIPFEFRRVEDDIITLIFEKSGTSEFFGNSSFSGKNVITFATQKYFAVKQSSLYRLRLSTLALYLKKALKSDRCTAKFLKFTALSTFFRKFIRCTLYRFLRYTLLVILRKNGKVLDEILIHVEHFYGKKCLWAGKIIFFK